MARLAEIAREYEVKLKPAEWVQSRLRWEDWQTLRPEAIAFAKLEIRRRKWRGRRGGVVPDGYDAESVANQVIEEMMSGKCRLAMGFTRERVVAELKRLVSQRVRVLHRLKETQTTRNEWKKTDEEGERVSIFNEIRDNSELADEAAVRREEEEQKDRLKKEFDEFLKPEPELRGIFGCLCEGVEESKEIGRRLGMDVEAVVRGRKKLERRVGEFGRRRAEGDSDSEG
ncbi:MAG TPA: hypothetical protein VN578_11400 [Candidatus Binatia bacterium]|nr:hypothetical protein [Candidatus Binatia bacterium]